MNNFLKLRVNKAEEHFYSLKSNRRWTSFTKAGDDISIDMGPIHTNGMRERATITRSYYNRFDGVVEWVDQPHS